MNRPLWRWWLFCMALRVYSRIRYESRVERLALDLLGWSVVPAWLASEDELAAMANGEVGDAF